MKTFDKIIKAYDKVNDLWLKKHRGLDLDMESGDGKLYLHFCNLGGDHFPTDDFAPVKEYSDTDVGLSKLLNYLDGLIHKDRK